MKKILKQIMLLTSSIFLLAACGNSNEETTSNQKESTDDSGVTEIEFWHTMEGVNSQAIEELVAEFNETIGTEENINVTPVFQDGKQEDKLSTLYSAGDTESFPNVVQIYSSGIPIIKDFENILTVEEMYASGEDIRVPQEDLVPNTVRAFSYDNQQIAMPFNASSILLYYNADAFEEVGINKAPETIADLAEVTETLTTDDRMGLNVQIMRYQLLNWIGGQGEYNFIGDNEGGRAGTMTKTTMGEDGSLNKFLNEWQKVIDSGGLKAVDENMNEEFALGNNAMAIMSSARITKIADLNPEFNWKTAPLPKVDANDKGGTAVGGGSVAMFDKGNEAENRAAWIFTQYMASPDVQAKWGIASGYLPTNLKSEENEEFQTYLSENPNYQVALEQMKASHENVQEPMDHISSDIDTIIDEYMLDFTDGKISVEETVDGMVNEINDSLTDYIEANE